jgi:anaerobic selenocysteine-containing dehydrogenase
VRNIAKYSPPLFERAPDARHDWEICLALWTRLRLGPIAKLARLALGTLGPEAIIDVALRTGPHKLSLKKLRAAPHGLDLGPLESRLPKRLGTKDKRIELAPAPYLRDLARLERSQPSNGLVVIGRRHLRSNNSWMHNSERLVKGPPRCTLLIHPQDATARQLDDGGRAKITTQTGAIELPVEVTDAIMPGVVSIPHGWGHGRRGVKLRVASQHAGESLNDILDPARIDELSGTAALTGQRVEVSRV